MRRLRAGLPANKLPSSSVRSLRAVACSTLICAWLGFCLALATPHTDDAVGVGSRAVGTTIPLNFTTPHVLGSTGLVLSPNEYDLGDAAFGSVITRYVTAEGGVRPYRFTSIGQFSLANAEANTGASLLLGVSGIIQGSTPKSLPPKSVTFLGTPGLHFNVTVTDSQGTNSTSKTGFFNLFLFDSKVTKFRFASDTLPSGRLGNSYSGRIDTLAGNNPVTISVLAVTNSGTGANLTLSDLGLFLSPDGGLVGRPLQVGTFQILARGTDGKGSLARSRRNPNVFDQAYTLVIADDPVTTGDSMTLKCSVTGDTTKFNGDSLKYQGLVNILSNANTDQLTLANMPFVFQLGGVSVNGTLDRHGKFFRKGSPQVKVTVSAKTGIVTVQLSKGSFFKALNLTGALTNTQVREPLQVGLEPSVLSSEVLSMAYTNDGGAYSLDYELGKNIGSTLGGNFQITSVRGKDGVAFNGQVGDAWKVGFMAASRAGVINPNGLREGFDNISAVNVRIGQNFAQKITGGGIIGAGPKVTFKGGPTDGLNTFNFDTDSAKGSIVTRILAVKDTGIPQAKTSLQLGSVNFTLGVDILRLPSDQPFDGEHGRRVFGRGSMWTDVPAARATPRH